MIDPNIERMLRRPIYPIGIQDFLDLRKRGAVYVDKTGLIYTLTQLSKFVFLSRHGASESLCCAVH